VKVSFAVPTRTVRVALPGTLTCFTRSTTTVPAPSAVTVRERVFPFAALTRASDGLGTMTAGATAATVNAVCALVPTLPAPSAWVTTAV